MISESSELRSQRAQDDLIEEQRQGDQSGAADGERPAEPEPQHVARGRRRARAQHRPLADGEVDHPGGLVDDHEGERDEGVERAGQRAVRDEKQKERQVRHQGIGYDTAIDTTRPWSKWYVCVTVDSATCPVALTVTTCRTRMATPS